MGQLIWHSFAQTMAPRNSLKSAYAGLGTSRLTRVLSLLALSLLLAAINTCDAQICVENEYVDYSQGQNAGDGVCTACPVGRTLPAGHDARLPRYTYNPRVLTWVDAEAACVAGGGHLTSIEDQYKADEMTALAANDYWIGGFKEVGNTDGQWAWVDNPTTKMGATVGRWTPPWDLDAGGDGERVDPTGIQIYLFARKFGDVGEWQFDRGVEANFPGHAYASICEAATCVAAPSMSVPTGCKTFAEFNVFTTLVTDSCCSVPGVECPPGGMPTSCTRQCAEVLEPMAHACGDFLARVGMRDTVDTLFGTCPSHCPARPMDTRLPECIEADDAIKCRGWGFQWDEVAKTCVAGGH